MPDPLPSPFSLRLGRLRAACAEARLGAFVVTNLQNLRYLTGFDGSAGVLVVAPDAVSLLADGRYVDMIRAGQAAGRIAPVDVQRVRRYDEALVEAIKDGGWRVVGYEAEVVTVAQFERWRTALPEARWHPTSGWVEAGRLLKDESELVCLRRAARILSEVARTAPGWVRVGRSEREIAGDIDLALRRAGFEKPAFDTIVATGPNTAFPHARPTERMVGSGELVLLDFGGVLEGYCVDLTRMVAAGRVGPDARALYQAVRDAHAAAVAAVAPGRLTTAVDRAARQVLEEAQLGSAFVHGTGHGLGLDVHEAPRVGPGDPREATRLEAGMVLTIEPGAYVVGTGGVRIEDDVLVTAAGREVLTDAPLDLVTV